MTTEISVMYGSEKGKADMHVLMSTWDFDQMFRNSEALVGAELLYSHRMLNYPSKWLCLQLFTGYRY